MYNLLCRALHSLEPQCETDRKSLAALAEDLLADYEGPVPDAKHRMTVALTVTLLSVSAAELMRQSDELFRSQIEN